MPRALKLYGGIIFYWDETHPNNQYRAIALASTKKEAAALFGVSPAQFNNYFCETGNDVEHAVAAGHTTGMWIAPLNYHQTKKDYFKVK
jgi:hypothetical protein